MNFVVGQASFTVFVVVLFNLLDPIGWRTGLVRVQDIAIGAGISVVVGALVWPRGASGVARAAFEDLQRAARRDFEVALRVTLAGEAPDDAAATQVAVAQARSRAVAALEDLAVEHGGGLVDRRSWDGRLARATVLRIAADGVLRTGAQHALDTTGCGATRRALERDGASVMAATEHEESRRGATTSEARATLAPCLSTHAGDGLERVLGLVWVHEWITLVDEVTTATGTVPS